MSLRARLAWAAAVLLALAAHSAYKAHAGEPLQEMLWGCHVASALCALGLALGWPRLVAAAFVYHLGVGVPAWALDALGSGTTPTSALVHLLPPLAAGRYLRHHGLPWRSAADAYLLALATWALALWATDPRLNVGAVFHAWGGLQALVPDPNASRALNALAAAPCLAAATWAARRKLGPRPLQSGPPPG